MAQCTSQKVRDRLREKGFSIPNPARPVAAYQPWRRVGEWIFISGQLPLVDGKPSCTGILGDGVSLDQGRCAAELAALNALAWLEQACGLDHAACVQIRGYVACTPGFTQQPAVIDGASDLMRIAFGEAGEHARSALGVCALPLGVPVEIEALFTRV